MNQKGFINIFIVVLVVAIAGVVGYFTLRKPAPGTTTQPIQTIQVVPPISNQSTTQPSTAPSASPENNSPGTLIANWKTYQNQKYKLSFKYPPNGHISEREGDEKGGPPSTNGSVIIPVPVSYTYYEIKISPPFSTNYPITQHDTLVSLGYAQLGYSGLGKALVSKISNRSEGKSCLNHDSAIFQKGHQVTMGGRSYTLYNPSWNETSGGRQMSKDRYYVTETTSYCYSFYENVVVTVPTTYGDKPPLGLNVVFGTKSENISDIMNQINIFFNSELQDLDTIVHTVKISG